MQLEETPLLYRKIQSFWVQQIVAPQKQAAVGSKAAGQPNLIALTQHQVPRLHALVQLERPPPTKSYECTQNLAHRFEEARCTAATPSGVMHGCPKLVAGKLFARNLGEASTETELG